MFWCGFAVGLSIGAVIGFFAAAMLAAGCDKED